jgi:hypothetical protein
MRRGGFVAGEKRQGELLATSSFSGGGAPVVLSLDSFFAKSPSGNLHLEKIPSAQKTSILLPHSWFVKNEEGSRKEVVRHSTRRFAIS